jgi:hypothetical protein
VAWLTSYMNDLGIDSKRIKFFTSKNEHQLANVYSALKNGKSIDASLNRKAEFKIIGITTLLIKDQMPISKADLKE